MPHFIVDYFTSASAKSRNSGRHFLFVYATGISAAYFLMGLCIAFWPHNSNGADLMKAELSAAIQIIGGAASTWLILGLLRIARDQRDRRSALVWLLVIANAIVAVAVFPTSYQ